MTSTLSHSFHMVNPSPWAFTATLGAQSLLIGFLMMFYNSSTSLIVMGLTLMLITMVVWFRDIVREAALQGHHTLPVLSLMQMGMALFILSEVMFFFSFFWAYFHSCLTPAVEIGISWPPTGLTPFNPYSVPMLNTLILLSSGATVTWGHYAILNNNHTQTLLSLGLTIALGLYFTLVQGVEYLESSFTISDAVYGSAFFVATGFHGLHVIIGTTFLLVVYLRIYLGSFNSTHHFGFEASAWYWHFVDVVWLFLFVSIYWWGS